MRDRVNVVILLLGIAVMIGFVGGVKASGVLNSAPDSAAEWLAEKGLP